jgi:hypothetical protein
VTTAGAGSPLSITQTPSGIRVVDVSAVGSDFDDEPNWAEWKFDSEVSSVGATLLTGNSGGNVFWLEFKSVAWTMQTTTTYLAPIAVDDSYVTAFNTALNGKAGDRDTFAAGSVFAQTSQPANGSVVWNTDGTYVYTPNPDFSGTDSFTYEITAPDGQKASATQFITILTDPAGAAPISFAPPAVVVVAPPIAVDDSYVTAFNTPVNGKAATADTFAAGSVFTQTSQPANGSVVWNTDGTYVYTPNADFSGTDSFTYEITAPDGQKASATQFITVQGLLEEPAVVELARTGADLMLISGVAAFMLLTGATLLLLRRRIEH